ncbi:hypothetical protein [Rheinheimera sp.]|uniref:hypothetical protein n=1 Tax=Rheinheimera sp. TaxID=1869214 RepID=UPI003D299924
MKIFEKLSKFLGRGGIIDSNISFKECLENGFRYAYWLRFRLHPFESEIYPFNAIDTKIVSRTIFIENNSLFDYFLSKAGSSRASVVGIIDDVKRTNFIEEIIYSYSESHVSWFRIGRFIFDCTVCLGENDDLFNLMHMNTGFTREYITKIKLNQLIIGFEGLGWSPDDFEKFINEKLLPYQDRKELNKWTYSIDMAVMYDLKYLAKFDDEKNRVDSLKERIYKSSRALIESIPIFGEAISIMIFGSKK